MEVQEKAVSVVSPEPFSFDALLAESMQQAEQRIAEKDLKKKIAKGLGTNDDNETVKRWGRERDWLKAANVLAFSRQQCKCCGSYSTTLDGKFELHVHSRIPNSNLLHGVPFFELDLPKRVVYRDSIVPVCHECADLADWPLEE